MRLAILATVVALGCGGPKPVSHGTPPEEIPGFPASRWVPADPAYVIAAPTVRDAQRGLRDIIDSVGMLAGVDTADVSRALARMLAVDALSTDALVSLGVDVEGGVAMFSQDLAPTFVLRLADPAQMQTFLDRERERGLVTQSVLVDGLEVFTAKLYADTRVSWAIADGWMWIHFSLPLSPDDGTAWLTTSRAAHRATWAPDWQWARGTSQAAQPGVVGFVDAQDVLSTLTRRVPDAVACVRLLEPVQRVGFVVEGDGKQVGGTLALDIGDAARAVTAATLPVPEGLAAVAANAPLALQWNLDLYAVRAWLAPCLRAAGEDLTELDRFGLRTARLVLQRLDPDDKSAAGVVAADLAHKRFFASQLDEIPMRSTLERSRTYGPLAGHSISIPFVATVDYVLTEKLALAGVGDGVLARMVGGGRSVAGPVASLDLVPAGLSVDAWKTLLGAMGGSRAEALADPLMRWRDGHLRLAVEGTSLVLTARGTRR